MVAVGGGPFTYGDKELKTRHEAIHLRGFCIDRYEHPNQPNVAPTVNVTWLEANSYCLRQSPQKRLCTEFEWEKAARGPSWRPFTYGSRFDREACRSFDLGQQPGYRTGTHLACKSPYGASDMSGGVWEWTENPFKPGSRERVIRGGFSPKNLEQSTRISYRGALDPGTRSAEVGFRCCHTPPGRLKPPPSGTAPRRPESSSPQLPAGMTR